MCDPSFSNIPLPNGWPDSVRSAVIYVISLAHYAITYTRGWAANSANARVRLAAKNDRLNQEIQLLREELHIKDARMAKIDPHRRPYYPPTERMAILELKAARSWSLAQVAKAFLVEAGSLCAHGDCRPVGAIQLSTAVCSSRPQHRENRSVSSSNWAQSVLKADRKTPWSASPRVTIVALLPPRETRAGSKERTCPTMTICAVLPSVVRTRRPGMLGLAATADNHVSESVRSNELRTIKP